MSIFGGNSAAPKAVLDAARKIMSGEEIEEKKKLDPVGQEDGDIDNDGDKDSSDEYLMKRRKVIKKAMKTDESVEEAVDVDAGNVEKALKHDCATHVQHEEHGIGRCIPEMHTLVQVDEETGIVTHYDVMFENDEGSYIVENVPVEEMKVLKAMNHGHKKKSMGENYAGNYGSSVASYNKEKDHEKRYEKENPGKKWKDLSWGHQQSHSDEYEKNPK